jgi:microcystin-dependent protein
MVDITKLDMTDIWASSGDKTAPDPSKIATGWIVEAVPRQWWNWFENRQDVNIAYMLQKGIPEWDGFTEYLTNKSYVQRNNVVYKCIATNSGLDPSTTPANWIKAFPESSDSLEAVRVLTPAADRVAYYTGTNTASLMTVTAFARTLLDDANVTTMRATLGAQATHPNLTALSSAASPATNTLAYFNSATTMIVTPFTAFGRSLLDDADAAAARATLGLGTAALQDVTVGDIDTTPNRVTTVGDFGIGAGATATSKFVPTWPNTSLNDITGVASGIYRTTSGTTNSINGQAAIVIYAVQNSDAVRATQLTMSTDGSGVGNSIVFRSCSGGTLAAPTWSTNEDMASKSEVYAQMAEFGLGDTIAPLITDLNTPAVTGFSRFANTATNLPLVGASGIVQTAIYATGYRTQFVITLQTTDITKYNRTFTRTMNSGTWGVWKESVDAASLATTLTGYALNGANTDLTSLTNISLNGVSGLTGALSSDTADLTTVPTSGGPLVQPKVRLSSLAGNQGGILSLQGYTNTTGNFGSTLVGTRSYGAVGAHGAVAADRSVLTLLGAASDGTKYNPISRIDYYTVNAQSGTNAGGEIRFLTTPINTLIPTLSMTIRNNGNVDIVGAVTAASLSLTSALPVASGGTGATTATAARVNLQAVGYDAVTGSAALPAGTTAQRTASPVNGQLRYNSDNNEFEGYINGNWGGIGGGTPLFTVLWWPSRVAIPAGYVPADGQLLTRTAYSSAFARINLGDVPSTTDAIWLSSGIYRGYYSIGNGSTTFRIPDMNGKVSGSTSVFLRGDGANSTGVAAQIQGSDNLAHSHAVYDPGHAHNANISANEAASTGVYNGRVNQGRNGDGSYSDNQVTGILTSVTNVSLYNSGGAESRPSNITGVWIIKLIGGASDLSKEDASVAVAALDAKLTYTGGKNRIINGCMRITQRGSGTYSNGVSGYSAQDRYFASNASAGGVFTQSSSTLVYDGISRPCIAQTVTTAVSDLSTNKYWTGVVQTIEGYNSYDLVGTPVAVSFILKTNWTGVLSVTLRDGGTWSYVTTIAVTANATTKYTILVPTVPVGFNATCNNGAGLAIWIGAQNNLTFLTSNQNIWQNGNFIAAQGSTQWGLTVGNFIAIAELQLEQGTAVTAFERTNVQVVQTQCHRYYETVTGTNSPSSPRYFSRYFKISKRVSPTITLVSGSFGGATMDTAGGSIDSFRTPAGVQGTGEVDWVVSVNSEF